MNKKQIVILILFAIGISGCKTDRNPIGAPAQAHYRMTFTATWRQSTHPLNFPPNPHFSDLIGATHSREIKFWELGAAPSPGIENMAELGVTGDLAMEIQTAINENNAEFLLTGGSIFPSPGSIELEFDISQSYPLATLVCMLAPSPDWFVGVSALNLFENGDWVREKIVELEVYDAGSDNGAVFTSPNIDVDPKQAISKLTASSTDFRNGNPVVGTFTFTRVAP